ncbi:lipopolysaccharide heptosyltransferase II [Candidatus Paracaedibacter symbiosus]|uniref:lipopolysaccharide heptosyltransferase II n=1 Tax=Candidatus Paracaedibacter symbiosus TaxID=244582 RepID=UPI0005097209|nr:lipopolysaccharide heptosyltransferase II [Candidatus Paracaedibacter symbiosus]
MLKQQKILIVAPAWVGDAVMSLGLIHRLKQQNPQAEITVLVVPWCEAVFKFCQDVTRVIPLNIPHGVFGMKARWQCAAALKAYQFDVAYVLPNSWKSALIPFLARIPTRIGFTGEMRWGLLTHCLKKATHLPLLVDKYQSLMQTERQENSEFLRPRLAINTNTFEREELLARGSVILDKPVMAFCPGAEYGPAKRWPASYYAMVAQTYVDQGWQIWILGSPKDAAVAEEIVSAVSGQMTNWIGKTSLAEAIYLLSLSKMVVTNDSGLMHVAAALSLPTVALFGSSSPDYTPPLSPLATIMYLKTACSPCFKRECPLIGDAHMKCLTQIWPQQVIETISEKLGSVSIL